MNLKLKIAIRYIFPKRSLNFISIITFISIIGIAIGVAALIVVLSILNGFRNISENMILKVDPNLRIVPTNSAYLVDFKEIIDTLENIDGIKTATPVIQSKAIIMNNLSI
jgi:lipoprotein-releasing system permease protein